MQQLFDPSLFARMKRAAMLDPTVYEEVEHDLSATNQAVTIVCLVAVANAVAGLIRLMLGAAFGSIFGSSGGFGWGIFLIFFGMIATVAGWVIWSYLTYWIGTTLFKGKATPGELLRTLGFASTPQLLGVAQIIPCLGDLVAFGGAIWMIVAGVVAVRQALDIETGEAIITVVLAAIPIILFYGFVFTVGIIGAAITSL